MSENRIAPMGVFTYRPPAPEFTPTPVPEVTPDGGPLGGVVAGLTQNLDALKSAFHHPLNCDFIVRELEVGGSKAALVFIDGMVDRAYISGAVLKPLYASAARPGFDAKDADALAAEAFTANDVSVSRSLDEVAVAAMDGGCALLIDGAKAALIVEARGFDKRAIGESINENIIMGPHEAFTESLRTNITQVRRIVKKTTLITEFIPLGSQSRTMSALMYDKDNANPSLAEEARRRLKSIDYDMVRGTGYIQQLIEDRPMSLFPQMVMTERPDRAASYIAEGQVVILCDGSPYALGAPATLFHLMNTPDDTFMRWQYGTLQRLLRWMGALLSVFLTGIYLACALYHSSVIPTELLISISETHARVPFPMLVQVLIMELSFDLIREAGTRVPGVMGSALGIIGALILGQAAVEADVISPILIIIVALSGLGGFTLPDYSLGQAVRISRLIVILSAAALGFVGIAVAAFMGLIALCSTQSFGVPFLAPVAPLVSGGGDLAVRRPLWKHTLRPAYFLPKSRAKTEEPMRGWDKPGGNR